MNFDNLIKKLESKNDIYVFSIKDKDEVIKELSKYTIGTDKISDSLAPSINIIFSSYIPEGKYTKL